VLISVSAAVEGDVDEAVLRRLLGSSLGYVYGKKGKPALRKRVTGYNNAARFQRWVLLVDLDNDFDCAPALLQAWLPRVARYMCFRVAIHAIESWVLADRERFAGFLYVRASEIATNTDLLHSPKEVIVNLARQSRRREIREDMVPRPESGRSVGPAYNARMMEFVEKEWRPEVAERSSKSLRSCRAALAKLLSLSSDPPQP
jgi:hypothetical protein